MLRFRIKQLRQSNTSSLYSNATDRDLPKLTHHHRSCVAFDKTDLGRVLIAIDRQIDGEEIRGKGHPGMKRF